MSQYASVKFFAILAVNIGIVSFYPYFLENIGMPSYGGKETVLLIGFVVVMTTKLLFSAFASKTVNFYRQGYEFSTTVFAATVSTIALQTISSGNLLPNLQKTSFGKYFIRISNGEANATYACLFLALGASVLASGLCAYIQKSIEQDNQAFPKTLAFVGYVIGIASLGCYVALIATKA